MGLMDRDYYKDKGLFVLIGAVSFALTILIFGEIPFFKQKTKKYSVLFNDVAGLSVGAEVRVAGIKAGRVTGFTIEEGKVRVFFEIREDIPVYKDAANSSVYLRELRKRAYLKKIPK